MFQLKYTLTHFLITLNTFKYEQLQLRLVLIFPILLFILLYGDSSLILIIKFYNSILIFLIDLYEPFTLFPFFLTTFIRVQIGYGLASHSTVLF